MWIKSSGRTTGCKPARAAPTANPQKPASVMGVSITRLGPNRSSSPRVTLYLHHIRQHRTARHPAGWPYAPLYCATSSPRINTFSLLSNSSARASFKASRTVISLVSVAYVRRTPIQGAQADCLNAGRIGDETRDCSSRAAGRRNRGAAIRNGREETERADRSKLRNTRDETGK